MDCKDASCNDVIVLGTWMSPSTKEARTQTWRVEKGTPGNLMIVNSDVVIQFNENDSEMWEITALFFLNITVLRMKILTAKTEHVLVLLLSRSSLRAAVWLLDKCVLYSRRHWCFQLSQHRFYNGSHNAKYLINKVQTRPATI